MGYFKGSRHPTLVDYAAVILLFILIIYGSMYALIFLLGKIGMV